MNQKYLKIVLIGILCNDIPYISHFGCLSNVYLYCSFIVDNEYYWQSHAVDMSYDIRQT